MILDPVAIAKALGAPVGAAAVPLVMMYTLFTPQAQYARHVAEERTTTVQNLIRDLQSEPSGAYHDTLCRTLEQTLAAICLDSREHPFCVDRGELMAKARCR